MLGRSVFHAEYPHSYAPFLKLHGNRQDICCLEKLHGSKDLIVERSLMQKAFIMKMKAKKKTPYKCI